MAIAIDDQATFNMLPRTNEVNCANIGSDNRAYNQFKNSITKSGDAAVIKKSGGA